MFSASWVVFLTYILTCNNIIFYIYCLYTFHPDLNPATGLKGEDHSTHRMVHIFQRDGTPSCTICYKKYHMLPIKSPKNVMKVLFLFNHP